MKLSLFLIIYLLSAGSIFAQFSLNSHNNGWVQVQNYNETVVPEVKIVRFNMPGNVNIPSGWSLLVRLNGPVTNSENMSFPVDKIKLRINNITWQGAPVTIEQIGAITMPVPMSLFNVALIPNSPFPLQAPPYKQYVFHYDIIIEGGAYLEDYKSWQNFNINFIFSVVNSSNAVIANSSSSIQMQVHPQGSPPVEDTYSLSIQGGAKNAVLEFQTMQNYTQGVQVEYPDALSVVSNTPYALSVRASHPEMYSQYNSLPVDIIKVRVQDAQNTNPQGTVTLSAFDQSILTAVNSSLQPRLFNLSYFTAPNDVTIIQAPKENYSTTLFYTLTPQ